LKIVQINDSYFEDARHFFTTRRQCTTGFWHLIFAGGIGPYIVSGPDILVINPIDELYNMDIDNYLYAAAYHNIITIKESTG